jgi:hypothetical protein
VNITIPTLLEKVQALIKNIKNKFRIIDVPGLEDYFWKLKIQKFIKANLSSILPIFMIDLTQGSANLAHFQFLKEVSRDNSTL